MPNFFDSAAEITKSHRWEDSDGDGDTDIITKVWNKDGDTYHADYWRNDND